MHESELNRELTEARDSLLPADQIAGRRNVERRVQKHQRRRIAAVLTVMVVLFVGTVAGLAGTGADEQGVINSPPQEELPLLVPTDVPADWTLDEAFETPLSGDQPYRSILGGPETTIHGVWTDGSVTQPDPQSRMVVVSSVDLTTPDDPFPSGLVRTEMGAPDEQTHATTSRSVGRVGDHWVTVWARNVSEAEASAIFGQLSQVEGAIDVGSLAGLDAVDEASDRGAWLDWSGDDGMTFSRESEGYVELFRTEPSDAHWSDVPPPTMSFSSVAVQHVDDSILWSRTLFGGDGMESTTFDGHPGFYDGARTELSWWPSPGVMITVVAPTEEQVLQIANSLTEVDEPAFDAFVATATNEPGTRAAEAAESAVSYELPATVPACQGIAAEMVSAAVGTQVNQWPDVVTAEDSLPRTCVFTGGGWTVSVGGQPRDPELEQQMDFGDDGNPGQPKPLEGLDRLNRVFIDTYRGEYTVNVTVILDETIANVSIANGSDEGSGQEPILRAALAQIAASLQG